MIVDILLLKIIVKDSNPKKTITYDVSIFTQSLKLLARPGWADTVSTALISTSPYESKLASG